MIWFVSVTYWEQGVWMKDNCLWITQFFCSSITLQCIKLPSKLHSPSGHPHPTHLPPSYSVVEVTSAVWAEADSVSRQLCELVPTFSLWAPLPLWFRDHCFCTRPPWWCYENKMIMSGFLLKPCAHVVLLLIYSQTWTLRLGFKTLHPVAPASCSNLSRCLSSP